MSTTTAWATIKAPLRRARRHHRSELTRAELKRAEAEAVQRYRTMTGMDEPLEERARRARARAAAAADEAAASSSAADSLTA